MQKIPKGLLCDLARNSEHKYTGENTGRRLRYLETCYDVVGTEKEEPEHVQARRLLQGGHIRVEYGKKHAAWYWFEPATESTVQLIQRGLAWFDSLPAVSQSAPSPSVLG
jgi:hypothetical protein